MMDGGDVGGCCDGADRGNDDCGSVIDERFCW